MARSQTTHCMVVLAKMATRSPGFTPCATSAADSTFTSWSTWPQLTSCHFPSFLWLMAAPEAFWARSSNSSTRFFEPAPATGAAI
jgi:hypothetical protein